MYSTPNLKLHVLQNLHAPYFSFICQLQSVNVPKTIYEALGVPEWKTVVLEEMNALNKSGTWETMHLPDGKRTVGCKWVFTVKLNSDESLESYKVRPVLLKGRAWVSTHAQPFNEARPRCARQGEEQSRSAKASA